MVGVVHFLFFINLPEHRFYQFSCIKLFCVGHNICSESNSSEENVDNPTAEQEVDSFSDDESSLSNNDERSVVATSGPSRINPPVTMIQKNKRWCVLLIPMPKVFIF